MAEHPRRLLGLAIGLEPRRLDTGRLQVPRTADELRGSERYARTVEFELEDNVGKGVIGSARRVVVQEAEIGEVTLGGGDGRALGMLPSIDDTVHEATKCK